jgi:hypothetical protein
VKAFLTREFFGIPVWGYGVALVIAGVAFVYIKNRTNTGQASPTPQINPTPTNNVYPYPSGTGPTNAPVPAMWNSSGSGWSPGDGRNPIAQSPALAGFGNAVPVDQLRLAPVQSSGVFGGGRSNGIYLPASAPSYSSPPPSPTPSQRAVYPSMVVTRTL